MIGSPIKEVVKSYSCHHNSFDSSSLFHVYVSKTVHKFVTPGLTYLMSFFIDSPFEFHRKNNSLRENYSFKQVLLSELNFVDPFLSSETYFQILSSLLWPNSNGFLGRLLHFNRKCFVCSSAGSEESMPSGHWSVLAVRNCRREGTGSDRSEETVHLLECVLTQKAKRSFR